MPASPATPHSSSSNSSTPTVRVSSPLNPSSSSTPTSKPRPLPAAGDTSQQAVVFPHPKPSSEPSLSPPGTPSLHGGTRTTGRSRGLSVTTIRPESPVPSIGQSLSRVASTPDPSTNSSALGLRGVDDSYISRGRATSFGTRSKSRSPTGGRERSLSPFRDINLTWKGSGFDSPGRRANGTETPPNGEPVTWWNNSRPQPRPWQEKRQKTIPAEQTEGWVSTRQKVAHAAANILGTAVDVAHEALILSVDVIQFAPVVGLQEAAKTLLTIWNALQSVEMNRLACLRLTERCATILISVREEIADAGDEVGEELEQPIARLVEAFVKVHHLLQKQSHRPFLKRYLKRDEIVVQIQVCDTALGDALGMFSLSIQVRILKQVLGVERQRQADMSTILDHIVGEHGETTRLTIQPERILALPDPQQALLDLIETGGDISTLPSSSSSSEHSGSEGTASTPTTGATATPLEVLNTIHAHQNERDHTLDMADLRSLMRTALQTSSDTEMIKILQVARDEMPEAIKTLQRALERACEKENSEFDVIEVESTGGEEEAEVGIVIEVESVPSKSSGKGKGKGKRKGKGRGGATMARSGTDQSSGSAATASTRATMASSKSRSRVKRDTLDREFIESGIESLRRLSSTLLSPSTSLNPLSLPSWTITRYEVDREEKIGIGFFSDVYRGHYQGREVAIKVLAESTPRKLFIREVEIWRGLKHENVLELLGASSTVGDPPWFLVSTYCGNGNLVEFLKRGGRARVGSGGVVRKGGEVDLLRIIHEIAKGMGYLHLKKVLHGDLKGTNILIDDRLRCVISDFGQSEIKSEVYRISGISHPHGTLRWQAPELMAGRSDLTPAIDVYAFAICCVEVLTNGGLPWPHVDDDTVRHFILKENMRPELPLGRAWSMQLADIVGSCWQRDPDLRPPFSKIEADVQALRTSYGEDKESPKPPSAHLSPLDTPLPQTSPDMRPIPLPILPPDTTATVIDPLEDSPSLTDASYETAAGGLTPDPSNPKVHIENDANAIPSGPDSPVQEHQSPEHTRARPSRNSSLSVFTSSLESSETDGNVGDGEDFGYLSGWESPAPADERVADVKNERRYRMLLQHEFHPSLTLPLWTPCSVDVGAVGYHRKPEGDFVVLFNALRPHESSGGHVDIPSMHGYGRVVPGRQQIEKRNLAQRAMGVIQSWLRSRSRGDGKRHINRRYSTPLRTGHKTAHLFTETSVYRYLDGLDTPKAWFKANISHILDLYGETHSLQREDVILVIGTLSASDYALYVSHNHPDGQLDFNVFTSPQNGRPWGQFSTSTTTDMSSSWLGSANNGPIYVEDIPGSVSASKVSKSQKSGKSVAVLLARLRFPIDHQDPTSR